MKHTILSAEEGDQPLDLPALLERLSTVSVRPRYAFMVLNLIARAANGSGKAGPFIREMDMLVPVRDWLCDALTPMAHRDPRRIALTAQVHEDLAAAGALPNDPDAARRLIDNEVRERVRTSGKSNVSRAVSELVKAGLLKRHYQGYRVNHHNRGGQRHAVYTITDAARSALS